MSLLVVLAGLGLLQLPWLLRGRLAELSPAEWTMASRLSLRAGLGVVQFGFLATAAPTVLARAGAHDLAESCSSFVGERAPGGDVTGWVAAFVLGWILFARWDARRHVRHVQETTRIDSWLGEHRRIDGVDLVVVPTPKPLAYTVPGASPQIVVSEGLRDAMSPAEFDAVVRHETSHLRRRHDRDLLLACELEAIFQRAPSLAKSTGTLRLAMERCADEDAITCPEHRHAVRDALTKTAVSLAAAVPAFTPVDTILARLDALDHPPLARVSTRVRTIAMLTGPVAAALAGTAAFALTSHHLAFALVNVCLD